MFDNVQTSAAGSSKFTQVSLGGAKARHAEFGRVRGLISKNAAVGKPVRFCGLGWTGSIRPGVFK